MKVCFFTFLTDSYKEFVEFDLFERSFKHFHPDIPLIVFDQNDINGLMEKNAGVDMYKIKATAAKTLYNNYDLVVNIDADHFIFDRLDEILLNDYDVAAPSNYNKFENVYLSINSYGGNTYNIVSELSYIQAGLIASSNKNFWDTYEISSLRHASNMTCRDNDVLNLVLQFGNFKFKLLDGEFGLDSSDRKCFYGCSSLGLESEICIINDKPCINGIPVKSYHVAKGHLKPKFNSIFNKDVVEWFYKKIKF